MDKNQQDLAIIEKVLNGNKALYAQIVENYKDYAFHIAFRILNNTQDAEDATQDAFVKAFHSLKKFNQTAKFSTWFYRIVFNMSISYSRKRKKNIDPLDSVQSTYQTPANNTLEEEDKKRFIEQAMKQLSPIDTSIITLFYMKEFSLEEISDILGIKPNTVKVKLFRARQRLANELKQILKVEATTL